MSVKTAEKKIIGGNPALICLLEWIVLLIDYQRVQLTSYKSIQLEPPHGPASDQVYQSQFLCVYVPACTFCQLSSSLLWQAQYEHRAQSFKVNQVPFFVANMVRLCCTFATAFPCRPLRPVHSTAQHNV